MSKWNKILLGLLVVQVCLAVFMFSKNTTAKVQSRELLLTNFDPAAIDSIQVFDQSENSDDSREEDLVVDIYKKDGVWAVKNAFDYPAKVEKVEDFLEKVRTLDARRPLAQGLDKHERLEVSAEKYERKVVLGNGKEKTTLFIGLPAGNRRTALRINDEQDVYGVSDFDAGTAAATVRPWIESDYLQIQPDGIAKATFATKDGFISMVPGQGGSKDNWGITFDGKVPNLKKNQRLDTQHARTVISSIRGIRVYKPVENKPGKVLASIEVELKPSAPAAGQAEGDATPPPAEILHIEVAQATNADGSIDEKHFFVKERNRGPITTEADPLEDIVKLGKDALIAEALDEPGAP